MDVWNSAVRATIPAIVAVAFALGRRYLPMQEPVWYGQEDEQRFSRLQWGFALAMIGVAASFATLSFFLLISLNRQLATGGEKVSFVLLPSPWMWAIFPFFGGIAACWEITLRIWKSFGDSSQASKYESWSNQRAGFDASRLLRLMTLCIVVPMGMSTVLALPIHTSVSESGFHIVHFASLRATQHTFSDVRKIMITDALRLRDGSLHRRPALIVYFSDGSKWSSADNREPDPALNEQLLEFIEEKTNLPIEHIIACHSVQPSKGNICGTRRRNSASGTGLKREADMDVGGSEKWGHFGGPRVAARTILFWTFPCWGRSRKSSRWRANLPAW